MRKKILSILMVLLLTLALVACGGGSKPDNGGNGDIPPVDGGGDGNGGDENAGGEDEVPPVGRPTEIVIMHGAVHEVDPRNKDFSGRERAARIQLHEEVEKELNVKIVYKPYPANAPWGPAREEAIINWHISGNKQADIYWLTTIWLGQIVNAEAIVPVDKWLSTHGKNIDDSFLDATTLHGQTWGMGPERLTGERGLFYNTALLEDLDLEDPVELWNAGEWTWDRFETYAVEAKNKISEGQHVLGSYPSVYAESLIPLNGGAIVDLETQRVSFAASPASETYTYLEGLYSRGLFETSPSYDSGSDAWGNGDVLFHPGNLWFVRADNRWGEFEFIQEGNIGVVPFPLPEGKTKDDYRIPLGGEAVYTIASNPNDRDKEELAFEVWNRIQLWETEQALGEIFEDSLRKTFDDEKFVDVYMGIYDKVYFDIHEELGIGTYSGSAWQSKVNQGVRDGTTRQKVMEVLDTYNNALDRYLGNDNSEE